MRLCLFLLIAGVVDAVMTHLGIVSGFVEEGNPVMQFFIAKSWSYFYLIKIFLPLALLGLFYLRPLKGWIKKLLISTCVLYFSVLVYHMVWIVLYLNTKS
ncbi:DUF5658 family protein [Neobacillus vireti]|uniref:DUF5658 domain-containing protein n=1 Tax=Neobacillus vireti LMG 21834 TaxID=1131730 RepID=A0AB94IU53_9BACI|nr:DUF5658 family protein [Neobacillus vireti]ETI70614.1 hypothetical protein BAVI_01530 [Neobacillus vireti LMG 21834]KLT15311.1 hypothetical protein AA980_24395 [Neobacillus vireti]